MSADLLRSAASLMRERAEAAQSGGAQWTGQHYWVTDYDPSDPTGQTAMQRLVGGMEAPDCDHYSSWHPAVALAVADWLDECADISKSEQANATIRLALTHHAVAVARAYLGEVDA